MRNFRIVCLSATILLSLCSIAMAIGPIWVDQQSVNIGSSSAPGRTGQWWCDNHFSANLGGDWECIENTGSLCTSDVPNNTVVQCGRLDTDGSTQYNGYDRDVQPFEYELPFLVDAN